GSRSRAARSRRRTRIRRRTARRSRRARSSAAPGRSAKMARRSLQLPHLHVLEAHLAPFIVLLQREVARLVRALLVDVVDGLEAVHPDLDVGARGFVDAPYPVVEPDVRRDERDRDLDHAVERAGALRVGVRGVDLRLVTGGEAVAVFGPEVEAGVAGVVDDD